MRWPKRVVARWCSARAISTLAQAGDETMVIKSGITIRGQGFATHIFLDPKTPPSPVRYFPIRIGTGKVPAAM